MEGISAAYLARPSQDGHALSRQGHQGGPVSGAPVPGVVNVHQGITPGGSLQVLSVKALRNTEKKTFYLRCNLNLLLYKFGMSDQYTFLIKVVK